MMQWLVLLVFFAHIGIARRSMGSATFFLLVVLPVFVVGAVDSRCISFLENPSIMCKIPQLWNFHFHPRLHNGRRFRRQIPSLFCMCILHRRKYPTLARVFYGGIVGCTVGQIFPKIPHFCAYYPFLATRATSEKWSEKPRCRTILPKKKKFLLDSLFSFGEEKLVAPWLQHLM